MKDLTVFETLTDYMNFLDSKNDLERIAKPVDRKLEIMNVATKSAVQNGPALLFENVCGFPQSLFIGGLATRERAYAALGTTSREWPKKFTNAFRNPMKCRTITEPICQQAVHSKEDVDLTSLPILWHHEKDAGHYISSGIMAARDPDSDVRNFSVHRLMFLDKNRLAMWINVPMHLRVIARKYLSRGNPCPVAVCIGTDPVALFGATVKAPYGMDEMEIASAIRGQPIELAKAVESDVEVPAGSELVIEGEFRPGSEDGYIGKSNYVDEAPFGEFTGYYGGMTRSPVLYVNAITHRRNFVFNELVGYIPGRTQPLLTLPIEGMVWQGIRHVCPEERIRGISVPLSGVCFRVIVSIKKALPAEGMRVAIAAFAAQHTFKQVIVVDDDIDPEDEDQVQWAIATRTRAENYHFHESTGQQLDPVAREGSISSKVAIDATRPFGGDKFGKEDVLLQLGPCNMPLEKVRLEDYLDIQIAGSREISIKKVTA